MKNDGKDKLKLPFNDFVPSEETVEYKTFFGTLDGFQCFCVEPGEKFIQPDDSACYGFIELIGKIVNELLWIIGRALQLAMWENNRRYCSKCSSLLSNKDDERAKICLKCNYIEYQSVNPAIMVSIKKDDKVLLARSQEQPEGFFSVLAGFLEPGETLEECVEREVKEEVNISIKNIKYFGSQPFAPSNSIMIAFTSEYDSGEIEIDEKEIATAKWFTKKELPDTIPPDFSLAGKLIKNAV